MPLPRPSLPPFVAMVIAIPLALPLAACAPDAVRNVEAKGFNAYLDTVQKTCANTRLGTHQVGDWLRSGSNDSDSDYVFWLDQTSRLYYKRISVQQYRDSIAGAMGGDKSNAAALDCIVHQLPPESARPSRMPGGLL
ncbi:MULTISPECIES: hypothetical protein [unclassified Cupriavidus]|uniref:hypothetical protein n=1 Tax=unclassified Cupriavidus TaxID=2640874 RepID=UPI0008921084|nr:hypothetical protein [Cupriavidus sp. YR651]SDD47187.1 hypothetical protein SAMN05216345_109165 [Cupriavidus sp. YR651]